MADGRIDGRFIIDKGGITQGIQKELGLSNQECKQLGSVWTQIINEFDDSNNIQVTNNKNETPIKSNNYQVHKDAIVQFSKDCWRRIIDLVNKIRGKIDFMYICTLCCFAEEVKGDYSHYRTFLFDIGNQYKVKLTQSGKKSSL